MKSYGTSDAAIRDLRKGSMDLFWWGVQSGYLQDLYKSDKIEIFASEKNALYYLGFNLRKKTINDIHFRRAVATLTDKDFIVRRILQGYAVKMYSVVPPGNHFWHNRDVPKYGEGLEREERIRKAYGF
jgi:ABC-type oligopeptide transport system substrate-binding subunit